MTDLRYVFEATLCLASSGFQWRMLPKDFPPMSTVQGYFHDWRDSGLWRSMNHLLVMSARELAGFAGMTPERRSKVASVIS